MRSRNRSTRARRVSRAAAIAVAAAVLIGAETAAAFATGAQQAEPVAAVQHLAAHTAATTTARVATAVHGWPAAPTRVRVSSVVRVPLRVSGGTRTIRLERRIDGVWTVVDRVRSTAGAATIAWRAPSTAGRVVLRVHVLHAAAFRAAITRQHTVAITTAPRAAAPSTPAAETIRRQLFVLVNAARSTARTCGGTPFPAAPALRRSSPLDSSSGGYATAMGTKAFFSHVGPDGSTMSARLRAVGITNIAERENIAAGQPTAAAVMSAWLSDYGHCANIMSTDVTRIGLGHASVPGSPYGQYWVQDFAG